MNTEQEALAAVSVPWYDVEQVRPGAPAVRAMIEAVDRHGSVQARLPVTEWPVTVGRDLRTDLVLDDVHLAGQHLSLEQHAPGQVSVQVLETDNGVSLGRRHFGRGRQFDWLPGQQLGLGRLFLRLRLADTPVAAELRLPRRPGRTVMWSLASLAAAMLLMLGEVWLRSTETQKLLQALPMVMVGALAGLAGWAGLWALATKLFSGHPQFWRHVRIASLAYVASEVLVFFSQTVAFAFSWENLGRFGYVLLVLVAALGIYRHLLVVAPQPRRGLAIGVALVVVLGLPAMLGTQWLKNKRLSNQLYMAKLFPPSWRVAAPVPVATFMQEALDIEKRLAARLKDRPEEGTAESSEDEE